MINDRMSWNLTLKIAYQALRFQVRVISHERSSCLISNPDTLFLFMPARISVRGDSQFSYVKSFVR